MVRQELDRAGRPAPGPAGAADPRREELLLPHRGRDPAHGGGGDASSPSGCKNVVAVRRRRAKRGRFDSSETLRHNLQYGGVPVPDRLRPQAQGQAAGHGPVRRLGLGAQRVALHAPVRLRPPGPLLEGPQLHLRRRHRRGDPALRRVRRQPGARRGAARQPDQRLRPLRLRPGVPQLPSRPPGGGQQADDGDRPRRRPQQLQSAARVGPEGRPAARQAGDLAESREPDDLGLRRQRDGPLRAVLHHRRGVPQPEPALPGHRPPGRRSD